VAGSLARLPGRPCEEVRVDEPVQVAVEDALRVSGLEIGPVVLDDLVRVEDIAPDLNSEAGVLHHATFSSQLLLAALLFELGQPRPENAERRGLVGRLRALVLALDDDAGRDVRDPDGR